MKKNVARILDTDQGKMKSILSFAAFIFTRPGVDLAKRVIRKKLTRLGVLKEKKVEYTSWITERKEITRLKKEYDTTMPGISSRAAISILLCPSGNSAARVQDSHDSIDRQLYKAAELINVMPDTTQLQKTIENAGGEWIMFMYEGDMLTTDCLFKFVRHINAHPTDQLIYADEDRAKTAADRSLPYFKPGWSPDSLLTRNYIGNAFIIKKSLAAAIVDIDAECPIYDLLLKATEKTTAIGRIPEVLFHTRERSSGASDTKATEKILRAALVRRKTPAAISAVAGHAGVYAVKYDMPSYGKVSILIPTKDQAGLLKAAIDSILAKTDYPAYEIIVLNNNSTSDEFFELMQSYQKQHADKFRCIDAPFPFNFARLMNLGVAESTGEYILMFNNDLEVIHNDWMRQMAGYAQQKHIGAVGAKLLYPDDTIQHAGIVLGINGDAGHVFVNMPCNTGGYFNNVNAATNYSAVTAACLMCRRSVYDEAGSMDESLEVEYNDIDLCLEFREHGYYNVYLPTAELYHHESATRGHPFSSKASWKQHDKEFTIFKSKWQRYINDDPYYNPNLSKEYTDFRQRDFQ